MDADTILENADKPKSVTVDGVTTVFRDVGEQIKAVEFQQQQARQSRSAFKNVAFGQLRNQGPVQ